MERKPDSKLKFDDEQVETFIEGKQGSGGTSADVFDMWQNGGDSYRTCECAEAVAAILIKFPGMRDRFSDPEGIETALQEALSAAEAIGDMSKAADILKMKTEFRTAALCKDRPERDRPSKTAPRFPPESANEEPFETVDDILVFFENPNRWDEVELRFACDLYRDTQINTEQMISFRGKALHYFLGKKYAKAEKIYRSLLNAGYEIPGTLCHLARVMIMTDRMDEAAEFIEIAWENRAKAPGYVLPRILFFQIILKMLNREDTADKTETLKNALGKPGSFMHWTIDPVLRHLKHKLGLKNHSRLKKISNAINDSGTRP